MSLRNLQGVAMINPADIQIDELPSVALSDKSQLPELSGIYFAIDARGAIQYIGRAVNLNRRWKYYHHRSKDLQGIDEVRIAYINCSESILGITEKKCISWFKPLLNGTRAKKVKPQKIVSVSNQLNLIASIGGFISSCRLTRFSLKLLQKS